jgi:hypothetical protein
VWERKTKFEYPEKQSRELLNLQAGRSGGNAQQVEGEAADYDSSRTHHPAEARRKM